MALDRLKGRRDKQMPPRSASCEVAHGPRQFSLSVVAQPSELLTDSKPLHRNRCAPFDLRPKGIAIVAACENDQRRGGVDLLGHCFDHARAPTAARSEEHTSELQSLMRLSYAVFCLQKKKKLQKDLRYEEIDTSITPS